MHVSKRADRSLGVVLTSDERYSIKQCLNECCHGFRISDFVGTIGASKADVSSLLDQINDASGSSEPGIGNVQITRLNDDEVCLVLTPEQARILINCLNETERVLGPREFPSRFGASLAEVKAVFAPIEAAL